MLAKKSLFPNAKCTLWGTGLLIGVLVIGAWLNTSGDISGPTYEVAKTVRYSFLVTNSTSEYVDDAFVSVFAPVKQNSYQLVEQITANQSFDTETDQSGNQSLLFRFMGLAPHSSQVISITAKLNLATRSQPFDVDAEVFLQPEDNIEVNAPEVRALANKLNGRVRKIASWLYKNIKDSGYIAEDRGARYAITKRKGDCTEFASAFVGLARSANVPARMIGGFTTDNTGRLRAENYHNWAEYKQDVSWGIADPQNNVLDSGYGSYIAFYNFDKHSRLENSQRFLSYDQRLSVKML